MTDQSNATIDPVWPDRNLTDNQTRVRQAAELMPVRRSGAQPENFAQLVDYATWMSKARVAVPEHLMSNVGACLAVIEIANKFNYPAYMVARQSYVVGNILTFMGQFIMAVINDFCPLQRRLQFRFEGEGPTLKVFVTGHFKGEVDPVEYESPTFAEIKVKNSPLWSVDPRQQFRYFGARRWQSAFWPEGLFGIYSPDDIADSEPLRHVGAEHAKDITPDGAALHDRLKASARSGEGFHPDAVDNGLNGGAAQQSEPAANATEPAAGAPADAGGVEHGPEAPDAQAKPAGRKRGPKPKGAAAEPAGPATSDAAPEPPKPGPDPLVLTAPSIPRTIAGYYTHVAAYVAAATDANALDLAWKAEKGLRGQLSVIGADYDECYGLYADKMRKLRDTK